jgi:O-antigen ligase
VTWAVLLTLARNHAIVGHGAGMTTELNPIVDLSTGIPFNAHDDFVRVAFENGVIGLVAYTTFGVLLCRWALRLARGTPPEHAPRAYAVVASLLALFFLTGGVPEFGTQTAIQYELYGMLALVAAITPGRVAVPSEQAAPTV